MPVSAAAGTDSLRSHEQYQAGKYMTETELNERIGQIESLRAELLEPAPLRRSGRAYRREMQNRKNDLLMRIVTRSYVPHIGYINGGFDGPTLLHSGKYIKYPQNSRCRKWIKRETGRCFRRCLNLPVKGNAYRRLFDYWWTLY